MPDGEWRRFEAVGYCSFEPPNDVTSIAALEQLAETVCAALGFESLSGMQVLSLATVPADMEAVSRVLMDAILDKAKEHALGLPWWGADLRRHLAQAWLAAFEPCGDGLWRLRPGPLATSPNPS